VRERLRERGIQPQDNIKSLTEQCTDEMLENQRDRDPEAFARLHQRFPEQSRYG